MTRADESQTSGEQAAWRLWSSDGLEAELARDEARRGLFPGRDADGSASGVTLGRYRVVRALGRGGMGIVFLARDPALGRDVAIKVLHSSPLDSEPQRAAKRRRIQREAAALGQLTHPHVVRVYDVGEERGHTYVAMEYVAGGTLRDWREHERLDLMSILRTYHNAGRGLAAAHAAGLLHRDFKPDNVLVAADGRVLVSDFGLVRATSVPTEALSSQDERPELTEEVTNTGTVLGTPAYMAPELFAGHAAEAPADQFAFCVSLFETIVGRRPFAGRFRPGQTPWSTFAVAESASMRPMPRWVRRLLIRGLQPDPAARFPNMDTLLRVFHRGMSTGRRRRVWWFGAVGSAAMFGAFVGLLPAQDPRVGHPLCSKDPPSTAAPPAQQRDAIEAALQAAELPDGAQAIAKVLGHLDEQVENWAAVRTRACARAPEQSEVQRARQLDCLQAEHHSLTALAGMLENVDTKTAAASVEFVMGRAPVLRCDDERSLRGRVLPPSDPHWAQRVEVQRADLARGGMLVSVGELQRGRAITATVRSSAEAEHFAPLALEAALLEARILIRSKQRNRALGALRILELDAEAHGHDRVALAASVLHLELLVDEARPPMEFVARLEHARARALRLGDDAALVNLEFMHAEHQRRVGNPERALGVATAALELAQERLGPRHPEVAYAHDYVNGALTNLNRFDEALEHKRAAISILERAYGRQSLGVSVLLNTAGTVARLAGEHDLAQQWHNRAIAIVEATLGPDSPRLTIILAAAAQSAQLRGDADEALRLLDRQLTLQDREGIASYSVRRARVDVLMLAGRIDAAAVAYREAEQAVAFAGLEVPVWDRADILRAGAQLALLQGALDLAASRASQAIGASQSDPSGTIYPLIVLAQAQLESGLVEDARQSLLRAVDAGAASPGTPPLTVAELRTTQLALALATNSPDLETKRASALSGARWAFGPRHPARRALEGTREQDRRPRESPRRQAPR